MMKKIILIGTVSCGKTTLCQRLNGLEQKYKKTQALEVVGQTIDTPGEYLEHRRLLRGLMPIASEADAVLFLIDPTAERFCYSAGQATAFPVPVAGVVTKIDVVPPERVKAVRELLEMTGANPIFEISSVTGEGMDELAAYLEKE